MFAHSECAKWPALGWKPCYKNIQSASKTKRNPPKMHMGRSGKSTRCQMLPVLAQLCLAAQDRDLLRCFSSQPRPARWLRPERLGRRRGRGFGWQFRAFSKFVVLLTITTSQFYSISIIPTSSLVNILKLNHGDSYTLCKFTKIIKLCPLINFWYINYTSLKLFLKT